MIVAVTVLAACSPFQDDELRVLVDEAAPVGSSLDCEWGSSTYEGEPDAWVGCWDYMPGTSKQLAAAVESRLSSRGFAVSRRRVAHMVQITASRGSETVCIDVLEPGFLDGRNTHESEVDPAAGEVFLDIWASKPPALGSLCTELPAWPDS